MPFPPRLLNDGEQVVLDLRRHWLYLVSPSAALAATVALAVLVSTWTNRGVILIPLLLAVLATLGWFLVRVAGWAGTNLVVTNQRVVVRAGMLRRGHELGLERVGEITVTDNLFTRMLGVGNLLIDSVGERGGEGFMGCPRPRRVRDQIQHQMELASTPAVVRRTDGGDPSPLEQLERLDELRRRGVISQAEFDAKKTQLLGRL